MTRVPDALALLTAARPADLDNVDEATRSRVLQQAWIAASSAPPPRGTARLRPGRLAALGAAALAVAVAAGWVLMAGQVTGQDHGRSSAVRGGAGSAAAILLAAAVHLQTTPTATTGRYWYSSVLTGPLSCARPPGQSRVTRGSTGLRDDRWVASSPSDASWFALSMCASGGSGLHKVGPGDWGQRSFDVEGRELTFSELARLPVGPAALRAFLLAPYPAGYRQSRPTELVQRLFGEAADLTIAPVNPAVRAAAYRLLADLPGIKVIGPVRDIVGRRGTAIAVSNGDVFGELIIDQRTGAVLETLYRMRAHGRATVTVYNAILASGWTNAVTLAQPAPRG